MRAGDGMAEARWRRVEHVVCTPMDDGVALLDLDRGVYFTFNATAAAVWNLLEAPQTSASIESGLRAEFAVDAATCARAVATVLERFTDEALIEPA